MTYIEAAKKLGVPKKSLNVYYLDIKIAQYLNFDFSAHMDKKVSILRKFCRDNQEKYDKESIYSSDEITERCQKFLDGIKIASYDMDEESQQDNLNSSSLLPFKSNVTK